MDQRYENGLEIHVGDAVSYSGQLGTVVFVADRREYSGAYPEPEWPQSMYPTGFMIEFTNGARLLLDAADEDLDLVRRSVAA
jgi:hypothetical protein